MTLAALARQIRLLRGSLDWRQKDLARAAGLHVNVIKKIEEEVGAGRVGSYVAIAKALGAELSIQKTGSSRPIYIPHSTDDFYSYYSDCLAAAQSDVWMTSDGFNMENPASRIQAKKLLEATREALASKTSVNRFQILDTMHLNWIDELIKLKEAHPNFRVFVNANLSAVPNVCAIDADSPRCVSERMEHQTGLFGQGSVAASFTFTHEVQEYAAATRSIASRAINHEQTCELDLQGLNELHEQLLATRVAQLKRWLKSDNDMGSISGSGVFDERVITQFLRTHKSLSGTI